MRCCGGVCVRSSVADDRRERRVVCVVSLVVCLVLELELELSLSLV